MSLLRSKRRLSEHPPSEGPPSERPAAGRLATSSPSPRLAPGSLPDLLWALLLVPLLVGGLAACGPQEGVDSGTNEAGETETAAAEPSPEPSPEYAAEIEAFREEAKAELLQEGSWLTLAGLYWLEEGESTFGSAEDNDVVFPEKAPAHLGTFIREGEAVRVRAEPGAGLLHDGEPVTEMSLAADASGEPTELAVGSLHFYVIQRPGMVGIRLKDREHPNLETFDGVEAFPIDPSWRIEARFEPYDPPKPVRIPNVVGTEFEDVSPGALIFERGGETWRLDPVGAPEQGLFVIFGDGTNGRETYGGGRFLGVAPPEDGTAILDFNKAYNPPCVYSPYATCPLPPPQNKLRGLRIEAGEKMWGEGFHEEETVSEETLSGEMGAGGAQAGDSHPEE